MAFSPERQTKFSSENRSNLAVFLKRIPPVVALTFLISCCPPQDSSLPETSSLNAETGISDEWYYNQFHATPQGWEKTFCWNEDHPVRDCEKVGPYFIESEKSGQSCECPNPPCVLFQERIFTKASQGCDPKLIKK